MAPKVKSPRTVAEFLQVADLQASIITHASEADNKESGFGGEVLWPSRILVCQSIMKPIWGFDVAVELDLQNQSRVRRIFLNPRPEHDEAEIAYWLWERFTPEGQKHAQAEMKRMWTGICRYVDRTLWLDDARYDEDPEAYRGKAPFFDSQAKIYEHATYFVCADPGGNLRPSEDISRLYERGILRRWLHALQNNNPGATVFAEAAQAFYDLVKTIEALPPKWSAGALLYQEGHSHYMIVVPSQGATDRYLLQGNHEAVFQVYRKGVLARWQASLDPHKLAARDRIQAKKNAEAEVALQRRLALMAYIEDHKQSREFPYEEKLYVIADGLYAYVYSHEEEDWHFIEHASEYTEKYDSILEIWARSLGWQE